MKESIFKIANIYKTAKIYLFFAFIILLFVILLKLIFPGLILFEVSPFKVSVKFAEKANEIIDRENPESSGDKDNKILSLQKQIIVKDAITFVAPGWQSTDSQIRDFAIGLRDLRESDPNSEIIPLTMDFVAGSSTTVVIGKLKAVDSTWSTWSNFKQTQPKGDSTLVNFKQTQPK